MKNIKEPLDLDLGSAPSVATERDFVAISATIAAYKAAKNKKTVYQKFEKRKGCIGFIVFLQSTTNRVVSLRFCVE